MKKLLTAIAALIILPVVAMAAPRNDFPPRKIAQYPVRLIIPAIQLDAPIDRMGLNQKGEMAVPSGATKDVGWYRFGTVPGKLGSAVIAAHVYAAFENLKHLVPGNDIYVVMKDGSKLRFVVTERSQYRLDRLSPKLLFNRKDDERLNLITCAGEFRPALGTYNERLVVYARLLDARG